MKKHLTSNLPPARSGPSSSAAATPASQAAAASPQTPPASHRPRRSLLSRPDDAARLPSRGERLRNAVFCCRPRAAADAVVTEATAPREKTWKLSLDRESQSASLSDMTAENRAKLFNFVSSYNNVSEAPIRISARGVSTLEGSKATDPLRNYTKGNKLGSGAFGTVFEYKHNKSNQIYAIKSLPLHGESTAHEIQASVALSGESNVVDIKKMLITKDTAFLVMERLQNQAITASQYRNAVNVGSHIFDVPAIQLADRYERNMAIRDVNGKKFVVQLDLGLLTNDYSAERTAKRLEDHAAGRPLEPYYGAQVDSRQEDDSETDMHFYGDYG